MSGIKYAPPREALDRTLARYEDADGSWVEIRTNHADTKHATTIIRHMIIALDHIATLTEAPDDDTDGA